MKLLGFELKKVLRSRFVVTFFLMCLVACFFVPYFSLSSKESVVRPVLKAYSDYMNNQDEVFDYYSELEHLAMKQIISGEEGTLPYIYDEKGVFDDFAVLQSLFERTKFLESHEQKMSDIADRALRRISELTYFGFTSDSYEIKSEKRIAEIYSEIKGTVSEESGYSYGYDAYLNNMTPVFLTALFTAASAAWIFRNDFSSGNYQIFKASKNGGRQTAVSKLLVTLSVSFIATVAFCLMTFAAVGVTCGFSFSFDPIQSFPDYYAVPFRCSAIGFVLLQLTVRAITFTVFSYFVSFVTSLRIPYVGCFFISAVAVAINVVIYNYPYSGTAPAIRFLNLASTAEMTSLAGFYRSVSLFGFPVNYLSIMIAVCLLLIVLFAGLSILIIENSFYLFAERNAGNKITNSNGKIKKCGIIRAEFIKNRLPFLLFSALLLLLSRYLVVKKEVGDMKQYREAIYYNYICALQKVADVDKYIEDEQRRLDNITGAFAESKEKFESGEMPREEYFEYLNRFETAVTENNVFSDVKNYVSYINYKNFETGLSGGIIYSSGYEKLFSLSPDWFMFLALIVLCSSVFAVEYTGKGFASILRTTKYGRKKVFITKMTIFMLLGGFVSLMFRTVEYLTVKQGFILSDVSSPLYSIEYFSKVSGFVTIIQFIISDLTLQFVCGALLSSILCILSLLIRYPIAYYGASIMLVLIPEITVEIAAKSYPFLSLVSFASPQEYVRYGNYTDIISYLTAIFAGFVFIAAAFIVAGRFIFVSENREKS